MEPKKDLDPTPAVDVPTPSDTPAEYWRKARKFAEKHYGDEMVRIWSTSFDKVTPHFFFLECVWVIHATGFNAKVVSSLLPRLKMAYGLGADGTGWDVLARTPEQEMLDRVLPVCNNPQKARAVRIIATLMHEAMFPEDGNVLPKTWEEFRAERLSTPALLAKLPYIGKVTCHHLARNIGILSSVKPDLHLVRLAEHWGFESCDDMCEAMRPPGWPLGIVDLVLWYASSTFGTLDARKEGAR